MSIDLATTQPVQQAGAPRPPGSPQADQLGLTLRERMWLARAALATMALSAIGFGVLLTMLPSDTPVHAGVLETHLKATADVPLAPHAAPVELPPAPPVVAPPLPEPVAAPALAPAVVATTAEPKPAPPAAPKVMKGGKVAVSRGKIAATMLPADRAVDLSKPQPLAAPKPVEREPEPADEPPPPPPKVLAKPKAADDEPALKRPSFE